MFLPKDIQIQDSENPYEYYMEINKINGKPLLDALPSLLYGFDPVFNKSSNTENSVGIDDAMAFFRWITNGNTMDKIIGQFNPSESSKISKIIETEIQRIIMDQVEGKIKKYNSECTKAKEVKKNIQSDISFTITDFITTRDNLHENLTKGKVLESFSDMLKENQIGSVIKDIFDNIQQTLEDSTVQKKKTVSARFSGSMKQNFYNWLKNHSEGLVTDVGKKTSKLTSKAQLTYQELGKIYEGINSDDLSIEEVNEGVRISITGFNPSQIARDITSKIINIGQKNSKQMSTNVEIVSPNDPNASEAIILINHFLSLIEKTLSETSGNMTGEYRFFYAYKTVFENEFSKIAGLVADEIKALNSRLEEASIFTTAIEKLKRNLEDIGQATDKEAQIKDFNESINAAFEKIKGRARMSDTKRIVLDLQSECGNNFYDMALKEAKKYTIENTKVKELGDTPSEQTYKWQQIVEQLLKSSKSGLKSDISGSIGEILLTIFIQNVLDKVAPEGSNLKTYLLGRARNAIGEQLHADVGIINNNPDRESNPNGMDTDDITSYGMQSKLYTKSVDVFDLYEGKNIPMWGDEAKRYFNDEEMTAFRFLFLNEWAFSPLQLVNDFNDIVKKKILYSRYQFFIRYADQTLGGDIYVGDIKNLFFVVNFKIVPTSLLMLYINNTFNEIKDVNDKDNFLNKLRYNKDSPNIYPKIPELDVTNMNEVKAPHPGGENKMLISINKIAALYQDINSESNLKRIENAKLRIFFEGIKFELSKVLFKQQNWSAI